MAVTKYNTITSDHPRSYVRYAAVTIDFSSNETNYSVKDNTNLFANIKWARELVLRTSTAVGVHKTDINHYFDDPYCQVFFKKPRNLDYDRMKLILDRIKSHIGKEYDYGNLMYFLLKLIIHIPIINKRAFFLDTPDEYMCSELVADALLSVKEYSNLYPLSKLHPSKISPMDLFKSEIFKEWRFED